MDEMGLEEPFKFDWSQAGVINLWAIKLGAIKLEDYKLGSVKLGAI